MSKKLLLTLLLVAIALLTTGCPKPYNYVADTHAQSLMDKQEDPAPDSLLSDLLELTGVQLNAAERADMLEHIEGLSGYQRVRLKAHLLTASGVSAESSTGAKYTLEGGTDHYEYPVPDGTTKVQFLQNLMTTSK